MVLSLRSQTFSEIRLERYDQDKYVVVCMLRWTSVVDQRAGTKQVSWIEKGTSMSYPTRKKFFEPQPLCWSTRKSAIDLLNESFPKQPVMDKATVALTLSLMPRWAASMPLSFGGICNPRNWCITSNKKVLGVTGTYQRTHDQPKTVWLAKTCVAPEFQGHGFGAYLIDFAIQQSAESDMQWLNAYTGRKNTRAIQILQRRGFHRIDLDHSKRQSGLIYFSRSVSNVSGSGVEHKRAA